MCRMQFLIMSLNERAHKLAHEMAERREELNISVSTLKNGTNVIDAGIHARGGLMAGIYLSRITLSDMAKVRLTASDVDFIKVPSVEVATDSPILATMASQIAGWKVSVGNFFAMASGPARVLAKKPKKLFEEIKYEEKSDVAVVFLECSMMPNEEVASEIAKACGVHPTGLYVAVAPTNSVACSVQVSARIVETGIHKLHSLGFDITKIESGFGVAPIAPVVGDETRCMGATNDCIIYCGQAYYTVRYDDLDGLKGFVEKVPSSTSRDYGKPFYDTFKAANFDFYKIDAGIFAPAVVTVNEIKSGKTFVSGKMNPGVLLESFGVKKV